MNPVNERIATIIAREDTVIFIGSGVSAWSGLPTWRDLLGKLANFISENGNSSALVERELANNDLLLAASYGFDQLTPQERCTFLREAIRVPSAVPSLLHEAIARLGNSCFITTNYDNLFEIALRQYRPNEIFEVITPLQQFEVSSIVQSRAEGFLFKPHGDIGSCDSIIITREDYRSLLGERRNVFETTRTLLASRPVVYIGFGLRDPDFLLIQDLLSTAFGVHPSDHYAIMPDLLPEEISYWRRQYGIHLIPYSTDRTETGSNQHRQLLDMLSEIAARIPGIQHADKQTRTEMKAPDDSARILAYARHARRLRGTIRQTSDVMPLTLEYIHHPDSDLRRGLVSITDALQFLADDKDKLIIQGPPGSGKSFILQQAVLALARSLEQACLAEDLPDIASLRVPIIVDMRDYRDDLMSMLSRALPFDLNLEDLLIEGTGAFFLDGINEAPVDSLESKSLLTDLAEFVKKADKCQIVLTTRFGTEVADLDLPVFLLDEISIDYVRQELDGCGFTPGAVSEVTIDLLRRPLFHKAWKDGYIDLEQVHTVHDIYFQLIQNLELQAAQHFGVTLDLAEAFGRAAYSMVDSGQLSMAPAEIYSSLKFALPENIRPNDFVNYTISTGTLIATPVRRLAFFHHSVTEYFAAHYLVKLIELDRGAVQRCLGRRDWDQALLLTLGFVPSEVAEQMFTEILEADRSMAFRALSYIEAQRSKWTGMGLQSLIDFPPSEYAGFMIEASLLRLDFDIDNVPELATIADGNTSLAGTAAGILWSISEDYKVPVFNMLLEPGQEYNFLTSLSRVLATQIDTTQALMLLDRAGEVSLSPDIAAELLRGEEIYEYVCIIAAVTDILRTVPAAQLIERALQDESVLVELVVAGSMDNRRTPEALNFSEQCIVQGHDHAISTLYFQLEFGKPDDSVIPAPAPNVIQALLAAVREGRRAQWALDALKLLGESVPTVAEELRSVTGEQLLVSALLAYSIGDDDRFFELLRQSVRDGIALWLDPAVEGLSAVQASWYGQEDLMLALLATRHTELAQPLLESIIHRHNLNDEIPISCSIEDLDPWIAWLDDLGRSDSLLADRLGNFLGSGTDSATKLRIIGVFDNVIESRRCLSDYVLESIPGLSSSDISSDAAEWLVGQLNTRSYNEGFHEPLIAKIATEELVQERLLPLYLETSSEPLRTNLRVSLLSIGRRHRRRYIGDSGQVLG